MTDLTTIALDDLVGEIRRRVHQSAVTPLAAAAIVVAAEAEATGIAPSVLFGRRRSRPIARARMRCMSALYAWGFTSQQVGAVFRRNHATVLHAIKTLRN